MTVSEFSVEFDILYNNIKSQSAPGVDEYEKSVFLTKAQEELVKNYFNPSSNKLQQGFDDSIKRQADFAELIKATSLIPLVGPPVSIDSRTQFFSLPTDLWLILNEQVLLTNNQNLVVIPIDHNVYNRLMMKPYIEPLKKQCWRMLQLNSVTATGEPQATVTELITKTGTVVNTYKIRYVKRPQPIILEVLTGGLTINNLTTVSQCELDPITHREILDRAVELAKLAYEAGDLNSIVQLNQRNE